MSSNSTYAILPTVVWAIILGYFGHPNVGDESDLVEVNCWVFLKKPIPIVKGLLGLTCVPFEVGFFMLRSIYENFTPNINPKEDLLVPRQSSDEEVVRDMLSYSVFEGFHETVQWISDLGLQTNISLLADNGKININLLKCYEKSEFKVIGNPLFRFITEKSYEKLALTIIQKNDMSGLVWLLDRVYFPPMVMNSLKTYATEWGKIKIFKILNKLRYRSEFPPKAHGWYIYS